MCRARSTAARLPTSTSRGHSLPCLTRPNRAGTRTWPWALSGDCWRARFGRCLHLPEHSAAGHGARNNGPGDSNAAGSRAGGRELHGRNRARRSRPSFAGFRTSGRAQTGESGPASTTPTTSPTAPEQDRERWSDSGAIHAADAAVFVDGRERGRTPVDPSRSRAGASPAPRRPRRLRRRKNAAS